MLALISKAEKIIVQIPERPKEETARINWCLTFKRNGMEKQS